jgi:hypothetical protein
MSLLEPAKCSGFDINSMLCPALWTVNPELYFVSDYYLCWWHVHNLKIWQFTPSWMKMKLTNWTRLGWAVSRSVQKSSKKLIKQHSSWLAFLETSLECQQYDKRQCQAYAYTGSEDPLWTFLKSRRVNNLMILVFTVCLISILVMPCAGGIFRLKKCLPIVLKAIVILQLQMFGFFFLSHHPLSFC